MTKYTGGSDENFISLSLQMDSPSFLEIMESGEWYREQTCLDKPSFFLSLRTPHPNFCVILCYNISVYLVVLSIRPFAYASHRDKLSIHAYKFMLIICEFILCNLINFCILYGTSYYIIELCISNYYSFVETDANTKQPLTTNRYSLFSLKVLCSKRL